MDIVERLREIGWSLVMGKIHAERSEAADEIERLREEVDHLLKMTIEWTKLHMEDVKEIRRLRELLKKHIDDNSELKKGMIDILKYLSAVQIAEINIKRTAQTALGEKE
jgi:hypothetical protein